MGVRIVWVTVAGFLAGVFLRTSVLFGYSYVLLFILIGCACFLLTVVGNIKKQQCILVGFLCISCGLGVERMDSNVLIGDSYLTAHLNKTISLVGVVTAEPDVRDTGIRLSVRLEHVGADIASTTQAKILVVVPLHTNVSYGDEVKVSGVISLPQPFDTDNGRQFNYPQYLAVSGIGYEMSPAQVELMGRNEGNLFVATALDIKQMYERGIEDVLPDPESGLATGITVGDKRSIGPTLSADFQKVSLIHMLVLSGYNITVVLNVLLQLFARASRYVQGGASVLVVVFFVLITGGASSALRAGIMALLAVYARSTNRTFDALRALGVTTVAMVLWNPFILVFDPSFQLSALATIGMIIYTPIIATRISWVPVRWGLREIVSSTMGTQLVVLPFLLYQSGQLSLYALPANALALLPVPIAMLLSFVVAMGGVLFGHSFIGFAFPAYILLSYIIGVAEFFAHLPFAAMAVVPFGGWVLVVMYICIFVSARFLVIKDSVVQNKTTS